MNINNIIIKPYVTEKTMAASARSIFTFEVNSKANKNQIEKAANTLFGVTVSSVHTAIRKGKVRRVGKRMKLKKTPNRKIAYIHVKSGTIDLFPKP